MWILKQFLCEYVDAKTVNKSVDSETIPVWVDSKTVNVCLLFGFRNNP